MTLNPVIVSILFTLAGVLLYSYFVLEELLDDKEDKHDD